MTLAVEEAVRREVVEGLGAGLAGVIRVARLLEQLAAERAPVGGGQRGS